MRKNYSPAPAYKQDKIFRLFIRFGIAFMPISPFGQKRLGRLLLGISIFFVCLFVAALFINWKENPAMFSPVFAN